MTAQEDADLLAERRCSNIKGYESGLASLTEGYQRDTKRRLYVMRFEDKVTRFHLPARASSHAKREALWMRRHGLLQICPEADADLLAVVRGAVARLPAT